MKKIFAVLIMMMFMVSCGGGSRPYYPQGDAEFKSAVEADKLYGVDKDIQDTKDLIAGYEKNRKHHMRKAVINDVKNHKERGAVKLDGHPTPEDIAARSYEEVAASEKEIDRLKRKLNKLKSKKRDIEQQQQRGGGKDNNSSGGGSSSGGCSDGH